MNKDASSTPVDTLQRETLTVDRFSRKDLVFEADADPVLNTTGTPHRGSVQVLLNVDGESFDKVVVDYRHAAQHQIVSAIEALSETLDVIRRLGS